MSAETDEQATIIRARDVIKLLDAFRAANPEDWLSQLRRDRDVTLGPYTAGELTDAIDDGRFGGWEGFVSEREGRIAPASLYEFARLSARFRHASRLPASHVPHRQESRNIPKKSADVPKTKPPVVAKKLSVKTILATAIAYHNREKKWPTVRSGIITDKPLADGKRTWLAINEAISGHYSGLTKRNCPYTSLADLLNKAKIDNLPLRKPKIEKLTLDLIREAAEKTHEATGRWPKNSDKQVKYGKLAEYEITWCAIDIALNKKFHGLNDCPYDTLNEFLIGEELIKPKAELSIWAIRMAAFGFWLSSITPEKPRGRWPMCYDGVIEHWPLNDGRTTWKAVDEALKHGMRGLTKDICPYKSLNALLIGEGLKQEKLIFTVQQIVEAAQATFEATGGYPTNHWRGFIKHGSLANQATWTEIFEALATGRVVGASGKPTHYTSIAQLLDGENVKALGQRNSKTWMNEHRHETNPRFPAPEPTAA